MQQYILALDQGTTSSRAILFDRGGQMCGSAQQEFPQHFPQPGWVEHDARDIWESQLACARQAMRECGVAAPQIAGIGIANPRETTVLWDRASGQPIAPAIVWQERRTAAACDALRAAGKAQMIQDATGSNSTPTSPPPNCNGCSIACPARAHAPGAANWRSAPSTAGWPSS